MVHNKYKQLLFFLCLELINQSIGLWQFHSFLPVYLKFEEYHDISELPQTLFWLKCWEMILQYRGYRIPYTSQGLSSSLSLDYLYESDLRRWDIIARDCPIDKNPMSSVFLITNRNSKGEGDSQYHLWVWCLRQVIHLDIHFVTVNHT